MKPSPLDAAIKRAVHAFARLHRDVPRDHVARSAVDDLREALFALAIEAGDDGSERVTVRLLPQEHEHLINEARSQDVTQSGLLRTALLRFFDHQEVPPQ